MHYTIYTSYVHTGLTFIFWYLSKLCWFETIIFFFFTFIIVHNLERYKFPSSLCINSWENNQKGIISEGKCFQKSHLQFFKIKVIMILFTKIFYNSPENTFEYQNMTQKKLFLNFGLKI